MAYTAMPRSTDYLDGPIIYSNEDVYDIIKTVCVEELGAELDRIRIKRTAADMRDFGESLEMPMVEEDSIFFDMAPLIARYPAICITPVEEQMPDRVLDNFQFTIEVFVFDANDGRVPRLLRRYCRAIANVIMQNRTLRGTVKTGRVTSISYYPARLKGDDGTFFRAGVVECEFKVPNEGA